MIIDTARTGDLYHLAFLKPGEDVFVALSVRCSLLSVFAPPCVPFSLSARYMVWHGAISNSARPAARESKHCAQIRPITRARARLCAHACAHAPLRVSLSSSERVQVLAGARPCSQVSRTARRDHRNSKLRGYIWGRFAASFWLGISKTPPLFEILRSALRACSGSMSTSMSTIENVILIFWKNYSLALHALGAS